MLMTPVPDRAAADSSRPPGIVIGPPSTLVVFVSSTLPDPPVENEPVPLICPGSVTAVPPITSAALFVIGPARLPPVPSASVPVEIVVRPVNVFEPESVSMLEPVFVRATTPAPLSAITPANVAPPCAVSVAVPDAEPVVISVPARPVSGPTVAPKPFRFSVPEVRLKVPEFDRAEALFSRNSPPVIVVK
jgi:hypothetical protein